MQVMIPNALQPAQIDEVFLYPRVGRAIVLVKDDQLSLAIGRRGQNVRLASKLVGWDIEIMTMDEMNESIERAEKWFRKIPNINDQLLEMFITEGFMSYVDITFLESSDLAELGGITEAEAVDLIQFAENESERMENSKGDEGPDEEENAGRTVAMIPDPDAAPTEPVGEGESAAPPAAEDATGVEQPAVTETEATSEAPVDAEVLVPREEEAAPPA